MTTLYLILPCIWLLYFRSSVYFLWPSKSVKNVYKNSMMNENHAPR